MTPARAWRLCVAAGVVAFLCSWGFGRIPGLTACGPSGGLGPIIALEFARSPADVAALFGVDPCRSTLVAAQRTALWLDALGFIPAYTAFLVLAALASGVRDKRPTLSHRSSRTVALWLSTTFLVAGLADEVEGVVLHRILAALPGTQALLDALWWPVHIKFALLGLGTLGIAVQLLASRRIGGLIATLPVGLGALTALAGLAHMPTPVMMTGFTIAWVSLLLTAIAGAVRPSLFAAP